MNVMPTLFPLVQFFYAYGFDHARAIPSVTTTVAASYFEDSEGTPSATRCVLDETAPVVLLDGRHRLQAMRELQKEVLVVWLEDTLLVRCVTRHDGCSIAETEALMLSSFANKMTSVGRCDSQFVKVVKYKRNLSAAFGIEHDVSFLSARMVKIVVDAVLSYFLPVNSSQTNQYYIWVAMFLLYRPISINIFEDIEGGDGICYSRHFTQRRWNLALVLEKKKDCFYSVP